MKKYSLILITILSMQSSIHAENWWQKLKLKVESLFDKNKKEPSQNNGIKPKANHEQIYELQQDILRLEASANGLKQKTLRAAFELKQMEEKLESLHHDIKEKQAKIKKLQQPDMMQNHVEHKHLDEHKKHPHTEYKEPQITHKEKPSKPQPNKK